MPQVIEQSLFLFKFKWKIKRVHGIWEYHPQPEKFASVGTVGHTWQVILVQINDFWW